MLSRDARESRWDGAFGRRRGQRVLALYEPGRSGAAALAEAGRLIETASAELTVVASAPQDTAPRRCTVYTDAYNRCVREEAAGWLGEARRLLGAYGERTRYALLVGGRDPPLEAWAAGRGFDLVLLPAHRVLGRSRHPAARRLRSATGAEIRVVGR